MVPHSAVSVLWQPLHPGQRGGNEEGEHRAHCYWGCCLAPIAPQRICVTPLSHELLLCQLPGIPRIDMEFAESYYSYKSAIFATVSGLGLGAEGGGEREGTAGFVSSPCIHGRCQIQIIRSGWSLPFVRSDANYLTRAPQRPKLTLPTAKRAQIPRHTWVSPAENSDVVVCVHPSPRTRGGRGEESPRIGVGEQLSAGTGRC